MNTSARQSLVVPEQGQKKVRSNGERRTNIGIDEVAAQPKAEGWAGGKPRVFVAAENRLLREVLSRMLAKSGNIEVPGVHRAGPLRTEDLLEEAADILLLTSRGSVNEDLSAIRRVRASAPKVQILLIGVSGEEPNFSSAYGQAFAGTFRKALRRRTLWKACERCKRGRRFVRAHSARCFSTISRGRQHRFLPRACTSG
jgi:DNA-binding NarL/FixJ family response regulator